ncbi:sugar phosphate isomerase/epimerase family protein [Amphiplicatus metriothermophilus]|uniref:Sugar phosphate isomerase/epimerase n=1 Tax=Amphiplicatus metriothermophilus TaxID=1519374 RepID=A0A239PX43_9PROT|nr:sugar phosphate isomerase/epimerase [Amphiplicatus metriothermophilus]MBB5518984.1 sugar phosphate isomerase/epimerase [Amphiplicatus metriothermophilus]SNT74593.1 Sugar phosphate isomerase/epimerase [Amphiplicatus metriothermophilus]
MKKRFAIAGGAGPAFTAVRGARAEQPRRERTLHHKPQIRKEASLSRRSFIAGAAGLAAATACGPLRAGERARAIGLQLYTIRRAMSEDAPAALRRVAEIGYRHVEFAGYFGMAPGALRTLLSHLGLAAPSAHMDARLLRDDPGPLIDAAAQIGHEFVVLGWLRPEDRRTIDQYKAWAETCNHVAERCRAAGLRFAWHNHDFEFHPIGGVVPYDVLLERADPDLVSFELDFYWARKAGQNILGLLEKAPARFPLCHVKDMDRKGNMTDIGEGVIDFAGALADRATAGIKHCFVERDDAPAPFRTAEQGLAAMTRILEDAGARADRARSLESER